MFVENQIFFKTKMIATTSFIIILVLNKETQAYSRQGFLRRKPCAENQLFRSKLALLKTGFQKTVDSKLKNNSRKKENTQTDSLDNEEVVVHNDAELQVDTNGSVKNRRFAEGLATSEEVVAVVKKRARNRYMGRNKLVHTWMRLRTF